MKNKVIPLIFSIMLLVSLSFISSANTITLITPAQDGEVSGSYVLNATLDTNTFNITSATFFYYDGSSNVTIGTTTNQTPTNFNYTWVSTALVDVNNYVIWVNCTNQTGLLTSADSSTGVDIDNGNPTASFSTASFSDNTAMVSTTSLVFGLTADSTIGISSCIGYFTSADSGTVTTTSMTTSANACTNTSTPSTLSLGINEVYSVTIQATDGNGDQTNATARTLRITPASGGGGGGGSSAVKQSIIGDGDTTTSGNVISNFFNSIINWFKGLFN
ncbi:MAG: hypothetical protein KKF48_02730 [Nanoarchaeota archaeon]|nr:hypothetical protein [Nanoarchaeota archaeon]